MTYKQALIGQPYAKRVNDVLEKLEWECGVCHGKGYVSTVFCGCSTCKNIGRLEHVWQPQVGEWCIWDGFKDISLIYEVRKAQWLKLPGCGYELPKENVTPILDWQIIEEILEKAGYKFSVRRNVNKNSDGIRLCDCIISNANYRVKKIADSRIKSVYEAVLELGKKEMK